MSISESPRPRCRHSMRRPPRKRSAWPGTPGTRASGGASRSPGILGAMPSSPYLPRPMRLPARRSHFKHWLVPRPGTIGSGCRRARPISNSVSASTQVPSTRAAIRSRKASPTCAGTPISPRGSSRSPREGMSMSPENSRRWLQWPAKISFNSTRSASGRCRRRRE